MQFNSKISCLPVQESDEASALPMHLTLSAEAVNASTVGQLKLYLSDVRIHGQATIDSTATLTQMPGALPREVCNNDDCL